MSAKRTDKRDKPIGLTGGRLLAQELAEAMRVPRRKGGKPRKAVKR